MCSESMCFVSDLLDNATTASVGNGASCKWKDDTTVLVTFGQGESSVYMKEELFARGWRWCPLNLRLLVVSRAEACR